MITMIQQVLKTKGGFFISHVAGDGIVAFWCGVSFFLCSGDVIQSFHMSEILTSLQFSYI